MSNPELTCADLRELLAATAVDMQEHFDELRELDAALGDGDLGITMELASAVMGDASNYGIEDDVGQMLATLGMNINRASPSTFGTLLATALINAGKAVSGKRVVGLEDLVSMGLGAVEGIKRMGKAEVGDKTMLDSLVPAVEAFQKEVDGHTELARAFRAAVVAGETGMRATTEMTAKRGRASWRREESSGAQDAGATAIYYLIQSFAKHASDRFS